MRQPLVGDLARWCHSLHSPHSLRVVPHQHSAPRATQPDPGGCALTASAAGDPGAHLSHTYFINVFISLSVWLVLRFSKTINLINNISHRFHITVFIQTSWNF